MSLEAIIIQRISELTALFNEMQSNAKNTEDFPEQLFLIPSSLLRVSNNGVSQRLTLQQIIDAAIVGGGVVSSPIEPPDYDDIAALIANQDNQTPDYIQFVIDASADPDVPVSDPNKARFYRYLGTVLGTIADYQMLSNTQTDALINLAEKLDRGGFTGTAQDIVDLIANAGGLQSVTADDGGIDNTDPLNPIFQSSLFQKKSEKGASNGYTPLGNDQKVPAQYLPSYVDDIIDGYYTAPTFYSDVAETIPIVGETGKIYIDLKSNRSYRWSGSVYARVDDFDLTAALSNSPAKAVPIGADRIPLLDSVTGFLRNFTLTNLVAYLGAYFATKTQYHEFACSDETSDLAAGTVYEQRLLRPFANCTRFDFGVIEAPTGSKIIIDVHKNGTTIFSTKPTIDISDNRTIGAAVQQVISGGSVSFAVGDIIKVIIDQVGSTAPGKNLKAQITYNS